MVKISKRDKWRRWICVWVAENKSVLYKKSVVSDGQGQDNVNKIKEIWKSTSAKEEDRVMKN